MNIMDSKKREMLANLKEAAASLEAAKANGLALAGAALAVLGIDTAGLPAMHSNAQERMLEATLTLYLMDTALIKALEFTNACIRVINIEAKT